MRRRENLSIWPEIILYRKLVLCPRENDGSGRHLPALDTKRQRAAAARLRPAHLRQETAELGMVSLMARG